MACVNDPAEATRSLELLGKDPEKTGIRCSRHWRDELPRLAHLDLPLVATGADSPHSPGEKKAPADLRTGFLLKGWPSAKHSVSDIQGACDAVISVGTRTGADAHGLLVFDIDGETALDWLAARDLDPAAVSTWQIHRDTDPTRRKVAFQLTEQQQQELGQIKRSVQTKPGVKEANGNIIEKGEAVEIFHQGGSQVIVLGQHYKSNGNYFWPPDMGPEALTGIPESWFQAALTIASTTTAPSPRSSSTKSSSRDWLSLNPCPICGRNTSDYCSQHKDGKTIRCFHGSTFAPPTGLKAGDLRTDRQGTIWAYSKTEPQSNGDVFSTFVEPDPEKQLSRKKQVAAKPVAITKPVKAQAEKLVEQLPEGWTAKIKVTSEGPVKTAERKKLKTGCLVKLLKAYIGDNLRFNELSLYAEYNNKTITSSELEHFYIQLSEHGYTIPKTDAPDCLVYRAKKHSYHPVREYLNHIKNDIDVVPVDISNLASKYLNSTNPLHDTMLRKTLIGAVARVMDPGCKFDTCLVLVGASGIGKSTFFKTLASPACFCDTAQEKDKDFLMLIHSTWIYELAELETKTSKKEAGVIKALLSGSTDKFRAPYAAAMEDHDRKSIFVATCNRRDFLRDETGSRRYWVIPVPNAMHEKIDVTGLLENRDAIWKAAVLAYVNGEKPFLNIQDELNSEQENKAYEPEDIWLAPMEHWLNKLRLEPQFTTAQALIGAGLRQRDHLSSDDQRRAAAVLRELGWVQGKNATRLQGKRARLWEVGTDDTDQTKGSVPAETDCAGSDPSVLAQITDKKAKTFEFLSTDGTAAPTPAPPREKTHGENKKDLCICANTLEPVALQPITAGTDPQNELCQAPSSVPELSDLGSGYDAAADGDDPHWGSRP